tara:strand:- start:306 stop:509 length:204 start_codon:yes stop_codon:yes gene_type:complete
MSSVNIEFEINTDNAAFADDKVFEINDIVFKALDTKLWFSYEKDDHIQLYDSNGNNVGYAKIKVYND